MADGSAIAALRERRRLEREAALTQPDTRTTIMQTAEKLLETIALHDLTVERIFTDASISRATFYSYFSSKYDVVVALLDDVNDDLIEILQPFISGAERRAPHEGVRTFIDNSALLVRRRRSVFRVVLGHWSSVEAIGERWVAIVDAFTTAMVSELEREADAGLVADTTDLHKRVAALLWASAHLLDIAGTGRDAHFPDESQVLDTLRSMWIGTLYAPTITAGSDA